MALLEKVIEYRPSKVDRSELITVAEAARLLGMNTRTGVINAMNRGRLQEFVDDQASYHARRLVRRSEVEAWAAARAAGGVEDDDE